MNKIANIELNGNIYTVRLNESKTAQQFAESAPFEASLVAAGNHCYGPIPEQLPVDRAQVTSNPHKGGVYYADHLQAIAVYYGDSGSIRPFEIVYIGDIQEDLSSLRGSRRQIALKVN
jgi:hypothetical protein